MRVFQELEGKLAICKFVLLFGWLSAGIGMRAHASRICIARRAAILAAAVPTTSRALEVLRPWQVVAAAAWKAARRQHRRTGHPVPWPRRRLVMHRAPQRDTLKPGLSFSSSWIAPEVIRVP